MQDIADRPVVVVSYSEIDTYRQCGHKWELGWRERWRPAAQSPALKRGTDFHTLMEYHYQVARVGRAGGQWPGPEAMLERARDDVLGGCTDEERELLEWMYAGYLECYGFDPDWEVLATEYSGTADLPDLGPDYPLFRLKFKIDLIARDPRGQIWSWDHKTAKNLPNQLEIDLDDQHGLYTWALRALGKDVFGSVHNVCRTERLKRGMELGERFKRWTTYRTDVELDNIAMEAVRTAAAAYAWEPGTAPRSPNPSTCSWKCDFLKVCPMGRKGMDERGLLADMGFTQQMGRH